MSAENIAQNGPVINTEDSGFFQGLNKYISIISIVIAAGFLLWVLLSGTITNPDGTKINKAANTLKTIQQAFNSSFGAWYLYVSAFYLIVCMAVAIWPKSGRIKLGGADETPEFSRFSWFSMMFGAGAESFAIVGA